ncbi:MAG: type IV toxin-antitoxin system AbiEi family antitoxin domain-containing protein [Thermoleophilia bacterium]|jgi:predicted transcriptional regulator of viral defense system
MGPQALELVSRLAQTGMHVVSIDDAAAFTKDRQLARHLLSMAARKGLLKRLQHGTYLIVPLEAGPDRQWSEYSFVIANSLANPAVISYLSAIRQWNWTEQLPKTVFIQTTQRKAKTRPVILGVHYQIVRVSPSILFGFHDQRVDNQTFKVSDKEKTLLDSADRPDLSGGIPTLVQALEEAVKEIDWKLLDKYLKRFPRGAAKKRLLFLIERIAADNSQVHQLLERWQKNLTTGIARLDPSLPARGPIVTRWRVRLNVSGFENLNEFKPS